MLPPPLPPHRECGRTQKQVRTAMQHGTAARTNTKSLCRAPETNITLYVSYTSILKGK